ncbi:hypothetical protein VXN63_02005 [Marinilactibacillus sp. XAAS-LB27]|nr:hypothetical protein [Marinilactibacillus sp. XAAS-LB27]
MESSDDDATSEQSTVKAFDFSVWVYVKHYSNEDVSLSIHYCVLRL